MKIQRSQEGSKGAFYYEEDGNRLAESTYSVAGNDKIIIDHTDVNESLRGLGVGYKLIETAVEYAREQSIKILPLCPFAASVFKKKPEYKDVLFG